MVPATRLAKGVKCPMMSRPVRVSAAECQTYQLFKAPCMGPECAFAHIHKQVAGEDNRIISVLYCKALSPHDEYVEIGEIDEK